MITKFKLFENVQVDINLPENVQNYLIDTMSFVCYKGTKRLEQKPNNYKSIRIKKLSGQYNANNLQGKEIVNDCLFDIEMTNKDKIQAKYSRKLDMNKVIENSIYIEINGELQYHLDDKNYNLTTLISMTRDYYKKYLEKNRWKVK